MIFYLSYSLNVTIHQIDRLPIKASLLMCLCCGLFKHIAHAYTTPAEASPHILFTILSPR